MFSAFHSHSLIGRTDEQSSPRYADHRDLKFRSKPEGRLVT